MNNIDIQTVNAQTPGIERSYVTRHQQGELEQRVFANELKNAEDEKMQQAQAAAETEQAKVHLQKERERQGGRSKNKKRDSETGEDTENESRQAKNHRPRGGSGTIDILV